VRSLLPIVDSRVLDRLTFAVHTGRRDGHRLAVGLKPVDSPMIADGSTLPSASAAVGALCCKTPLAE